MTGLNLKKEFNDYLKNRNREIEPHLRELIDNAIASGKVKRIPQGEAALSPKYVWDENKRQLITAVGPTYRELMQSSYGKIKPHVASMNEERKQRAAQREEEIKALLLSGKSLDFIAEERKLLGESEITTRRIAKQIIKKMVNEEFKNDD